MYASSSRSSDTSEEQGQAGGPGSELNLQDDARWRTIRERADGNAASESNELTALAAPPRKTRKTTESELQALLGYALKALARREHSSIELRRKLDSRASGMAATGRSQQHIDQVIEALTLDGSLSDERFVAEYVRTRIAKGFGPLRIRMELLERGVPDRLAEHELTRPSEFWQEQAARVCQQKFAGLLEELHSDSSEFSQQRWNRCARFLSQRGFPADLIYRTLDGRLLG